MVSIKRIFVILLSAAIIHQVYATQSTPNGNEKDYSVKSWVDETNEVPQAYVNAANVKLAMLSETTQDSPLFNTRKPDSGLIAQDIIKYIEIDGQKKEINWILRVVTGDNSDPLSRWFLKKPALEEELIASNVSGMLYVYDIKASPDGRYLAVVSAGEGARFLEVIDLFLLLEHKEYKVVQSIDPFPGGMEIEKWDGNRLIIGSGALLTHRRRNGRVLHPCLGMMEMQKYALTIKNGHIEALSEGAKNPVAYFINELSSDYESERANAATALMVLNDSSAVNALEKALAHEMNDAVKEDLLHAIDNLIYRIIPGARVGEIDGNSTEADLKMIYGRQNVIDGNIPVGEGEYEPGTVIFPNDDTRKLEIFWYDSNNQRLPKTIIISGTKSKWHTDNGISLGTTLRQLEKLNKKPFVLTGFGWDYSGTVIEWKNGNLKNILGDLQKPSNRKILLRLGQENESLVTKKEYSSVGGDKPFPSDNPVMQKLNPAVYEMEVEFPENKTQVKSDAQVDKQKSEPPKNAQAQADLYFTQKQFDKALDAYKAIEANPGRTDWPPGSEFIRQHAQSRINLIEENINDHNGVPLGMYAEAVSKNTADEIKLLKQIKQLYPDSLILDDADLLIGGSLYDISFEERINYWKAFLVNYPKSPLQEEAQKRLTLIYENLAGVYYKARRCDLAEKWYRLFLQQPVLKVYKYHFQYIDAGELLEERGQLELAELAYKIAASSGFPNGYIRLGLFYERHYGQEKLTEFLKQAPDYIKKEGMIDEYKEEMNGSRPSQNKLIHRETVQYSDVNSTDTEAEPASMGSKSVVLDLCHNKNVDEPSEYILLIKPYKYYPPALTLDIDSALFDAAFLKGNGFKILECGQKILCISNPGGGNGWNANPVYVISLDKNAFLKNLGQVTGVGDFDNDGIYELFIYEDIWESGLGWFGHWGAPGAKIYYKIENSELVPDTVKNTNYWNKEIREFDEQITILRQKVAQVTDANLVPLEQGRFGPDNAMLCAILQKFLRNRLLGEYEKAWEQLHKDLTYRDDKYFYFNYTDLKGDVTKIRTGKFPVQEIEQTIKKSLEQAN